MQGVVPKGVRPGENRVAVVPESVGRLGSAGLDVAVEPGAGGASGFPGSAYTAAGATIGASAADADVLVKVRPPLLTGPSEVAALKEGAVLIGFLEPLTSPE